jgi:hypothetical protein
MPSIAHNMRHALSQYPSRAAAFVLVVVCFVAVGVAQTTFGKSQLKKVGLYPPPTAVSELYFASPATLPQVAHRGRSRQTVAFIIRNQTSSARIYAWQVSADAGRESKTGSLALGASQQKTITRRLAIVCLNKHVHLTVSLAAGSQRIGFWKTCHDR